MSPLPDAPTHDSARLAAIRAWYQNAAIVLLNVLVALVLANLLLWAAYAARDAWARGTAASGPSGRDAAARPGAYFSADGAPVADARRTAYQMEWFDFAAYGGAADEAHAARVLDDFYDLSRAGFVYQPWTQFTEPWYDGDLVHVDQDEKGFLHRRTRRGRTGPPGQTVTIFILGGSTTFGYNVSDEETWPSFLSEILDRQAVAAKLGIGVEVVNLGRGYYTPSQESVLLMDLFKSGHRPDLVIFMDGVNWGPPQDVPQFTKRLETGFREMQLASERSGLGLLEWLPMTRLARQLGRRSLGNAPDQGSAVLERRKTEHVVERFLASWKVAAALCDLYGSEPLFFVQPDPIFNYSEGLYRRPLPASFREERAQRAEFHARIAEQHLAVDLTALFSEWGTDRKAIIDDVHYSPAFNRFLATQVARHVDLRSLRQRAATRPDVRPTGAARDYVPAGPRPEPSRDRG